MKKLFTLTMLALFTLVGGVNAQNYRKWDFTNWSATTIANLAEEATKGVTGGAWSDTEKADGTNPQAGNCYWSYANNVDADGNLTANGVAIAETEGLVFNTAYTTRRSLAIAVNYSSTSLGEYAGPQYLWLGGGNAKSASARIYCFTIPKVRVGQKITITAESHKPTDSRGVSLFAGNCTNDALLIGESFTPKTLETKTWEEGWTLPEGATTNADGTVDIQVYNTNGCHLYSIEVGDNTQKSKVAYIYNGATDAAFTILGTNELYDVVAVEATGAFSMDVLADTYDVVVLSPTLNNAEAISSLKDIRPFVPVLNLNPNVYTAWDMGTLVPAETDGFVDVTNTSSHTLFRGLEIVEDGGMFGLQITSGPFYGVTPTGLFADDQVLATIMGSDVPAIHVHNMTHNGYIYLPACDAAPALLHNALSLLANSKAKVAQAPKPTFSMDYKNMQTYVTIKSGVPAAEIFYTLDGSEPTISSTRYTEPVLVSTSDVTIKAVALGEGYLLSEVAEQAVDLKQQAPMPTISVAQKGNFSIVTLACDAEGVNIYYNYEASSDSTKSSKYTGPITLITTKTITAFTASAELVASELAQQEVAIETPLVFTETLAHMDAAKDPYYDLVYNLEDKPNTDSNSKVAYFFSWGKTKTAYSFYDTTADPISTTTDPETGDEVNVYPKNPEEKFDFQNGWAVRSRGHVICTEITIKPGKDIGNGSTYNPATVDEFELQEQYPVTDFYVNISEWNTADPRSGMIYSTQKFKGPFAVVSYISNGNSGTGPKCVFETGTDIEGDAVDTEWNQIGDICVLDKGQRLYQKFVRVYTGTDEVYLRTRIADGGSKAGYYDIYVLGLDASSINLDGIVETVAHKNATAREAVYSLSGVRQNGTQRGLNIIVGSDGIVRKVMVK